MTIEVRIAKPVAWARIAKGLAEIERALGADASADVRALVIARSFRTGVLAREDVSGVHPMPCAEAAE
jgi:hypothetical protein